MRVTQWGEYGVLFCMTLAERALAGQHSVSAIEISNAHKTDSLYAQQILQRLRKGGIIKSIRGPLGGYQLTRDPKEINLHDILKAAEGDTFEIICETKPVDISLRCSPEFDCSLRKIWVDLKDHINKFLSNETLHNLINKDSSQIKNDLIQISH